MKVEIEASGMMVISSETELEEYALGCWCEKNDENLSGVQCIVIKKYSTPNEDKCPSDRHWKDNQPSRLESKTQTLVDIVFQTGIAIHNGVLAGKSTSDVAQYIAEQLRCGCCPSRRKAANG